MVGEGKVHSTLATPYLGLPEEGSQPINDGIYIVHPSVAQEVAHDPACGWFACGTLACGLLRQATSLRLRHHHSTITPARAAGRGRPSGADVMSRRPPRTRRPSARAPRPAIVKVIIEAAKRGER